jgi:predicted ATP-dependent Lon-type protease
VGVSEQQAGRGRERVSDLQCRDEKEARRQQPKALLKLLYDDHKATRISTKKFAAYYTTQTQAKGWLNKCMCLTLQTLSSSVMLFSLPTAYLVPFPSLPSLLW